MKKALVIVLFVLYTFMCTNVTIAESADNCIGVQEYENYTFSFYDGEYRIICISGPGLDNYWLEKDSGWADPMGNTWYYGSDGRICLYADYIEYVNFCLEQLNEESESAQTPSDSSGTSLESIIPYINQSITYFDTDFEVVKIRIGNDLSGPSDSWRDLASGLFLTNIEEVSFYLDVSTKKDLFGIKNGQIVIYSQIGLSSCDMRVEHFLPNEALSIYPAVFTTIDERFNGYVWALDNGYIALIVFSAHGQDERGFYDGRVVDAIYVTDLEYLSFVK